MKMIHNHIICHPAKRFSKMARYMQFIAYIKFIIRSYKICVLVLDALQVSKNDFKGLLNHLPKSFQHCINSTLFSIYFCIPAVCIIFEMFTTFLQGICGDSANKCHICGFQRAPGGSYV